MAHTIKKLFFFCILSYPYFIVGMDQIIPMADKKTLRKRLDELSLNHFMEKTAVVKELAGKKLTYGELLNVVDSQYTQYESYLRTTHPGQDADKQNKTADLLMYAMHSKKAALVSVLLDELPIDQIAQLFDQLELENKDASGAAEEKQHVCRQLGSCNYVHTTKKDSN